MSDPDHPAAFSCSAHPLLILASPRRTIMHDASIEPSRVLHDDGR